jgi:hypothetical protein
VVNRISRTHKGG